MTDHTRCPRCDFELRIGRGSELGAGPQASFERVVYCDRCKWFRPASESDRSVLDFWRGRSQPSWGWFGEPWPSGVCDDPEAVQHSTPTGHECMYCREPIAEGEQGIVYASGFVQHRECGLRSVLGSVAHLERRCGCFVPSSLEGDPEGLTLREGAIAVWLWVQEHGFEEAIG